MNEIKKVDEFDFDKASGGNTPEEKTTNTKIETSVGEQNPSVRLSRTNSEGSNTPAKTPGNDRYRNMKPGDSDYFYEGYKAVNFDKTYGQQADDDLVEAALKIFNEKDGFMFLFNPRHNYLFSVVVPSKFRNMDDGAFRIYRAQVHSTLLKTGTEAEQINVFCTKVAAMLKYVRNR